MFEALLTIGTCMTVAALNGYQARYAPILLLWPSVTVIYSDCYQNPGRDGTPIFDCVLNHGTLS